MSIHSIENRNATYFGLDNLTAVQLSVLNHLERTKDGATRHEIAEALRRPLSSVCGRVNELEKLGLIESTAERRPTPFGKEATVVRIRQRTVVQPTLF